MTRLLPSIHLVNSDYTHTTPTHSPLMLISRLPWLVFICAPTLSFTATASWNCLPLTLYVNYPSQASQDGKKTVNKAASALSILIYTWAPKSFLSFAHRGAEFAVIPLHTHGSLHTFHSTKSRSTSHLPALASAVTFLPSIGPHPFSPRVWSIPCVSESNSTKNIKILLQLHMIKTCHHDQDCTWSRLIC